eukprot:TRINITY_DN4287_c0_g1_i1.p1 TRINITY_DN4287_c0_g1~~TRINITY_DN4287_c0_g1_i1.p1  ORF type:complete len:519 (-),score=117.64 TRINITY_DN4287_c0_g1_i1:96-1652(-)
MSDHSRVNFYKAREDRAWNAPKPVLPVTIVTGFLGSGKTTLLKHVVNMKANLKIAVAINDYAGHADTDLLEEVSNDSVIKLNGGCMCCSLVDDLKTKVYDVHSNDLINGKVQYLVLETSGVTDPNRIIKLLEENFGKMYYIRLDSVVTVIDSDSMFARFEEQAELGVAMMSQIVSADVLLLNKTDLIDEKDLSTVEAKLLSLAPHASIHKSTYAKIPLPYLLDIENVTADINVMSHEASSINYLVSTGGKTHRKEKNVTQSSTHTHGDHSHSSSQNHLQADNFSNVVFNSSSPMSLSAFQDVLCSLPSNIVRAKGSIFFEDSRSTSYLFHLSGRHRYEIIEHDSQKSSPHIHLVFIGEGLQADQILPKLESAVSETQPPLPDSFAESLQQVVTFLEASDYFSLLPPSPESTSSTPSNVVEFKLDGSKLYNLTETKAKELYGVDLNAMTLQFVQFVNSSPGRVLISYAVSKENMAYLKYSPPSSSDISFRQHREKIFAENADKVNEAFFGVICGCKRMW